MTAIDTDVVAVQKMFDINVFGPMRMVRHFHDLLIRAKGAIVNIGSIGGLVPYLYGCETISMAIMLSAQADMDKLRTMPPRPLCITGVTPFVLSWHRWSKSRIARH